MAASSVESPPARPSQAGRVPRNPNLAELKRTELSVRQERAILVGVILPKSTADPRDPLGELASLAKTAGARVVGTVLQKRARPESGTYIGTGKAKEIAQMAL